MAALLSSFSLSLHTNHSFHQLKKPSSRTNNFLITCSSQLPTGKERISEHKEEEKKIKKKNMWGGVMEELGRRGIKLESLMSPKHKGGDWKDLVLMSLSFAVYVYISQRLVCTYCAWISLLKQHSSF